MNPRIFVSLIFVAGCSGTLDIDSSASAPSQGTGTSQAEDTGSTSTTSASDGPPTTGPTTSAGGTEQSGSQGSSQSGTGEDPDTGNSGSSGETTISETTTGETTTGLCMGGMGPAPVELGDVDDLGAPAAYAVLAKAAITSVPGTAIVGGHVGVSPAAATSITGFSLVLDASGVYSTSTTVLAPGKVYAADYTVPTPILLTTAVLAMQAAYTDAAGRVPTDYLDLKGGKLKGLTLAPGIYTWGSTVLVPDDLTIEGCEDDVWIFQISGDLDVSTGKKVILAGGAQAKNVFWQVAGQATIHANAHFEGVLLSKTGITFQTEASLHGRAFAQTMVALDQNAVTAP